MCFESSSLKIRLYRTQGVMHPSKPSTVGRASTLVVRADTQFVLHA